MTNTNAQQYVTALEAEREGYERLGNDKRVAEVDEQLAFWRPKAEGERRDAASRGEDYLDPVDEPTQPAAFRLPGADPNAQRIPDDKTDETAPFKARIEQLEREARDADGLEQRINELNAQVADHARLASDNETLRSRVTDLEEQLRDARAARTDEDVAAELKTPAETAPNVQEKEPDVFTLPDNHTPTDDASDAAEARKAAGEQTDRADTADEPQKATPAKKPRQTR
jgi:hypothetical protein